MQLLALPQPPSWLGMREKEYVLNGLICQSIERWHWLIVVLQCISWIDPSVLRGTTCGLFNMFHQFAKVYYFWTSGFHIYPEVKRASAAVKSYASSSIKMFLLGGCRMQKVILHQLAWSNLAWSDFDICSYWSRQLAICHHLSVKWLAVKTASEMTYTVSLGCQTLLSPIQFINCHDYIVRAFEAEVLWVRLQDYIVTGSAEGRKWLYTVSQKKCTNFETVQLKIIRTDFDDIWQKYSKYSRIKLECFSFPIGLLFYQLFIFQTGHRKECEFWRCIKQIRQLWWSAFFYKT